MSLKFPNTAFPKRKPRRHSRPKRKHVLYIFPHSQKHRNPIMLLRDDDDDVDPSVFRVACFGRAPTKHGTSRKQRDVKKLERHALRHDGCCCCCWWCYFTTRPRHGLGLFRVSEKTVTVFFPSCAASDGWHIFLYL